MFSLPILSIRNHFTNTLIFTEIGGVGGTVHLKFQNRHTQRTHHIYI